MFDYQLDSNDFCSTLEGLIMRTDVKSFVLFYDRAGIHTSKITKEKIKNLNFEPPIRNLTARPVLNGIEAGILVMKQAIKAAKLRNVLAGNVINIKEVINEVLNNIDNNGIKRNCIAAINRWNR